MLCRGPDVIRSVQSLHRKWPHVHQTKLLQRSLFMHTWHSAGMGSAGVSSSSTMSGSLYAVLEAVCAVDVGPAVDTFVVDESGALSPFVSSVALSVISRPSSVRAPGALSSRPTWLPAPPSTTACTRFSFSTILLAKGVFAERRSIHSPGASMVICAHVNGSRCSGANG